MRLGASPDAQIIKSSGLPALIRNAALQRKFLRDRGWDFHANALTLRNANVLAVRTSRVRRIFCAIRTNHRGIAWQ
jgi:hypothetical protein